MSNVLKKDRPRRVAISIPVTYSNLGIFLDSEIMNLSKGGVFLRSDIALPLKSTVDFEFALPGESRVIKATGMVVWSRTKKGQGEMTGMGVQFVDMSSDDIEAILDHMEKLIKESN